MGKVSQRSVAFDGILINTRVGKEVGQAIIAEGLRTRRSTAYIAEDILRDWYEAVYLPSQQEQTKKKPLPG